MSQFPMPFLKCDQIAFLARSDQDERSIKKTLGLSESEWIHDTVRARGYVQGNIGEQENVAHLQFCYSYGIEFEILRYIEGPCYPDLHGLYIPGGRICHIGFHVDKGSNVEKNRGFMMPTNLIQKVETQVHTNPFLVGNGRRYRYEIYDAMALFGFHLKTIERIERAE